MNRPLRIAIPKGSLCPESIELLGLAGLDTNGLRDPGRQLRIRNGDVEFMFVRPTDAPVFCAYGGADCAISGEDSIQEAALEVIELADLKFGACRFVEAQPAAALASAAESYRSLGTLRVATKYPKITQAYYARRGVQIEIVKLYGNIELAPLIGMADCIVDITATGTTLRENNLVITGEVMESTARFIANPAALRTDIRLRELAARMSEIAAEKTLSAPIPGSSTIIEA